MPIHIEQLTQRLEERPDEEYSLYVEELGNLEETLNEKGIDFEITSFDEGYNLIIGRGQNISGGQNAYFKLKDFVKGIFKGGN